jgi:hypothetical protein
MKIIKKIWHKFWSWLKPYFTPKMIPIIITVYFFTNIVWYVIAFVPIEFIANWLSDFAKGYIAFLWLPFSAEKPVIILVSVFLYRIIYKEKFIKKGVLEHESSTETTKCKELE